MIRLLKYFMRLLDYCFIVFSLGKGAYLDYRLNFSEEWAYRDLNKK